MPALVKRVSWLVNSGGWPVVVFAVVFTYLALRVPTPAFLLSSNDQGYQMALGMTVAKGHFPGLDFITQYGPGVAFASYLAFALTGNAVGEMFASILGYAVAIAVGSEIVRRSIGWKLALLATLSMLLWFPRFYKWYYCLLPLLGLVGAQAYFTIASRNARRLTVLAGWSQLVGLTGLFRYDLGLQGCVFGVLAIIAADYANGRAGWRKTASINAALFSCGSLIIPVLYAAWILIARDQQHLAMFARSIYDGTADTVDSYSIAPFQLDSDRLFSTANALALLQVAVPITCLAGCVVGLRDLASQLTNAQARGFTLFCVSLVGIGVYPQSMHRADLQHLLQVGFPFIIVFTLLAGGLLSGYREHVGVFRLVGVVWFVITLAAAFKLLPGAAIDLGPLSVHTGRRWWAVAALPASTTLDPSADMAMALRRLTSPASSVFLVLTPTDMPMLFFGQRYQAGIFPVYESGMFSSRYWLDRNRTALTASPPDYLVVPQSMDNDPAPFMPDVISKWESQYRTKLYENTRYRLLAR